MPVTGAGLGAAAGSVLRTIAYHEITALTAPINIYNLPAISRNGARAIYTAKSTIDAAKTDLWVINMDGSGLSKIDTSTYGQHLLGISDDGSRALLWNSHTGRVSVAVEDEHHERELLAKLPVTEIAGSPTVSRASLPLSPSGRNGGGNLVSSAGKPTVCTLCGSRQ